MVGSDGPLIPFAIVESQSGERAISRFTTGKSPAEARAHAREQVARTSDCVRYAIAADGTVAESGQRVPVVMVESGDRRDAHGYCFIQRFSSTPTSRFAQAIDKPSIIAHPAILRPASES